MKKYKLVFSLCSVLLFCAGCDDETFQPRPKGYFRLDFPVKEYKSYEGNCPFTFEYPVYTQPVPYSDSSYYCWFNLVFPSQYAKIHFSYHALQGDLSKHIEESRKLAYKHTIKALDIQENVFRNDEKKVYALSYNIYGNTASSIQFFITDSTTHFLRGALYFSSLPNADSLRPAIDFVGEDIDHLIKTFDWKDQ